jgi:hypothetical protein
MLLRCYVLTVIARADLRDRITEEAGEGVISAAIAVLIMALLGAAMWGVFSGVMTGAGERIQSNVNDIGG